MVGVAVVDFAVAVEVFELNVAGAEIEGAVCKVALVGHSVAVYPFACPFAVFVIHFSGEVAFLEECGAP